MTTVAPVTKKGTSTRTKILTQARLSLVEKGYAGMVLRDVAQSCKMKLGNLQYYFPSRDALLTAIIEEEAINDLEVVSAILKTDQSPEMKLRKVVSELVRRWRGDSAIIFSTLNLLVLHDENYRAIYDRTRLAYYDVLEEIIADNSSGETTSEYRIRARLLCSLIDGVPYQISIGRKSAFMSRVQDIAVQIATGKELAA